MTTPEQAARLRRMRAEEIFMRWLFGVSLCGLLWACVNALS